MPLRVQNQSPIQENQFSRDWKMLDFLNLTWTYVPIIQKLLDFNMIYENEIYVYLGLSI